MALPNFDQNDFNIIKTLAIAKKIWPDDDSARPTEMLLSGQDSSDLIQELCAFHFPLEQEDSYIPPSILLDHNEKLDVGDEMVEETKGEDAPLFPFESLDDKAEALAEQAFAKGGWLSNSIYRLLVGSIFSEPFYAYFFMQTLRLALYVIGKWMHDPNSVHLNTDHLDAVMDGIGYFDTPWLAISSVLSILLAFFVNLPLDMLSQTPKKNTKTALKGMEKIGLYYTLHQYGKWMLGWFSLIDFLLMSVSFSPADYAFIGDHVPNIKALRITLCLALSLLYIPAYLWQLPNVLEVPQQAKKGILTLYHHFRENPLHNAIFLFNTFFKIALQCFGRAAGGYFALFNGLPDIYIDSLHTRTVFAWFGFTMCAVVGGCIGVPEALSYPFVFSGADLNASYRHFCKKVLGMRDIALFNVSELPSALVHNFYQLPFPVSQRSLIGYCDLLVQLLGFPLMFYFGLEAMLFTEGADNNVWPFVVSGITFAMQLYVIWESSKAKAFHELNTLVKNYGELKKVVNQSQEIEEVINDASDEVNDADVWVNYYVKARSAAKEINHLLLALKEGKASERIEGDIFDVAELKQRSLMALANQSKQNALALNDKVFIPAIYNEGESGFYMDLLIFFREFVGRNLQQALFFFILLPEAMQQRQDISIWFIATASCVYAFNRMINFRNEIREDLSNGFQDLMDIFTTTYRRSANCFFSSNYDVKMKESVAPESVPNNTLSFV